MKILTLIMIILTSITLFSCSKKEKEPKILYYVNPMDPSIKSDKPAKDQMGMDYIPVYEEESEGGAEIEEVEKKILYYVNPMNPSIRSDKPAKDHMGMDYIPVYEGEEEGESDLGNEDNISSVTLSEADLKKINVKTSKVEYRIPDMSVKTYGKISYNEQKIVHVSARVSGRVDKLMANYSGLKVKKGQALLLLYSPSIVTAQEELLQAKRSMDAGGDPNITRLLYDSAKNKLSLWGMSDDQIQSVQDKKEVSLYMPVYSPINGTITRMEISQGMYVEEGMMIYEIVDLSNVWLDAEVYEQDLSLVKLGYTVEANTASYPGKKFTGKISFINPTLDPMTRTVKIRAEFNNIDDLLKPGMYVDAMIKVASKEKMLVIPVTALLDTGVRKIVYVSLGNGRFVGRVVTVKPKTGDFYPILSGLKENDEVVTYGAFLIDSQAQLSGSSYIEYEKQ